MCDSRYWIVDKFWRVASLILTYFCFLARTPMPNKHIVLSNADSHEIGIRTTKKARKRTLHWSPISWGLKEHMFRIWKERNSIFCTWNGSSHNRLIKFGVMCFNILIKLSYPSKTTWTKGKRYLMCSDKVPRICAQHVLTWCRSEWHPISCFALPPEKVRQNSSKVCIEGILLSRCEVLTLRTLDSQ